ncbi:Rha family transcriptional regulator, partial [Azospirillum sp. TSO5]|uniref:Rha family transcriptional regulator n=1 Tax=Azospirillum sp. TSO5 TaxID=716760 RepID=UPI000D60525C
MSQTMVQNAICFVRNGAVYANSRDVAAFFEKRHDHVLRDVRAIKHEMRINSLENKDGPKIGDISEAWFIASTYTDGSGRRQDQFDMTRDGFTLLAMGFTGAKALAFKIRYIQRFNEMEAALRAGTHQQHNPTSQDDEHP